MTITVTLLGIAGVLVGMAITSGAPRHSPREFWGSVLVLASVAAIPVAAALQGLAS